MRVLALISDRPWPPISGSRVRNAHLWPAVRRLGVEVRLLGLDQGAPPAGSGGGGEPVELHPFDRDPFPLRVWGALRHSYHEWPRSGSLARRVSDLVEEWSPDVVHAEELRMAAYLPEPSRAARRPIHTVTLHNVESDLLRQTGSSASRHGRAWIEAMHLRSLLRFERRALHRADLAFAYSMVDLARYRKLHPAVRWAATRSGINASEIAPAPQPAEPSVLLLGSLSYAPNVRGLLWFLDRVLPLLPSEWRVTVAGSHATQEVRRRLAGTRVRFVDTPESLGPLYREHAVSAVPLFQGSGTRGKILEALGHERMVVSTTLGAEGLDLAEDEGVVLADDAEGFASEIRRWAGAPRERGELARRGREAVLRKYDWPGVAADLVAAWTACASD